MFLADNRVMEQEETSLGPILTAHLLPKVDGLLLEVLRSLTTQEWEAQTIAPQWNVKDVAAHLLDTQLRKLSIVRDSYVDETPIIHSPAELVALVNRLNERGVQLYRRVSPQVLICIMEEASRQQANHVIPIGPKRSRCSIAGTRSTAPN
jgi:hypothetical protein